MGTFSSSHLARMGQYRGSSRYESPKLEWVFQPLKPSSVTQRSSSSTAWSTSLGASVAQPPKRSGCLAMASARTLLASSATFAPTSAGRASTPGEVWDRYAKSILASSMAAMRPSPMSMISFFLAIELHTSGGEPLATVLEARVPLVIGQSLQPGLGDEVVLQVDSHHSRTPSKTGEAAARLLPRH